ncbi:tRNA (uracil-O(2)-)-methyltransferase [Neolecta irregularis DAH-3]|uniref:tRNA (uracil-O(2)-)-methyltransferase n=1 Tax=Neolecta irregularis (strain DAH-3) TaxID=1198029 RepID=A0A1U7LJI3_NEOID|nr:tRNA (uracil-O(2)-)-methyltransferase [Neolecta irregularis DAH-3]|eukprot:OLL22820.1 tRNA (uracil-O(2)-)-methyltransferase [Neolecta irregularis DAH-3]
MANLKTCALFFKLMLETTIGFEPRSYGPNATSPFGDSEWVPMLQHIANYPIEVFDRVIDLLSRHPERNSTNILRADILDDITYLTKIQINGWSIKNLTVRRFIPRNPIVDRSLDQTCTVFTKAGNAERLVILEPHGDAIPFYHPNVKGIAYLYDGETVSLHILPVEEIPAKTERTCYQLLRVLHKFCVSTEAGYIKKFHHDLVVPREVYQDKYQGLKIKYGKEICSRWVEKTDPTKHVFEDLGIAAFLITLWGDTKATWVDLGCGNGLLVHILQREGYEGYGVDFRRRKSWDVYPGDHRQKLILPLEDSFPPGTFFIGNHADQLAPWVPLIAALCPDGQFISIPCCAYSLDGSKYSGPWTGQSKYAGFTNWICSLAERAGWEIEKEYLRIPSTRNIAIIGRQRRQLVSREKILSIISQEGGMTGFSDSVVSKKGHQ